MMSIFSIMQGKPLAFVAAVVLATAVLALAAAVSGLGCGDNPDSRRTTADSAGSHAIPGYDLGSAPDAVIQLPSMLREVSGIVITPEGRLFAHNDERAAVFQVDTASGELVKQFALGERRLREDVEDIAVAGEEFYLVTSGGSIFGFAEGGHKEHITYTLHNSGLTAANDIEGVCHDPETGSLLLACKADPGNGQPDVRAIYAFDIGAGTLTRPPRFQIGLKQLREQFNVKEFMPSGIARHPRTGHFFVLSSVGNSLVELSPGGAVVAVSHLPKHHHEQPEGISFDENGSLFIANEGRNRGSIAVYREKRQ